MLAHEVSIQYIEETTGLSRQDIAQMTGVSERTVDHWAGHRDHLVEHCRPERARVLTDLAMIGMLGDDLMELVEFKAWLRRSNAGFGDRVPHEMLLSEGPKDVLRALTMVAEGGEY